MVLMTASLALNGQAITDPELFYNCHANLF